MKVVLLNLLLLLSIASFAKNGTNSNFRVGSLDYCVVDTICYDNCRFRFYWDKRKRYFLISDNGKMEILGLDFGSNLTSRDYERYIKKYEWNDYEIIPPIDKVGGENNRKRKELDFAQEPKCFVRFLVRGAFFCLMSYAIDGIYAEKYPFKDPDSFYLVYVPLWKF